MARRRPIMLAVLSHVLGWRTYSDAFIRATSGREDVEMHYFSVVPGRFQRIFVKRHNRSSRGGDLVRIVDPIRAYRGRLGEGVRREIRRVGPDVIHFGGTWPAAARAFEAQGAPFSVAIDCTRPAMERLKGLDLWSPAERAREAALLSAAARVYPWSDWAAGSVVSDHGVPGERVSVMPPSILLPPPPADRVPAPGRLPRIVFIGNDFLRKGGDLLVGWVRGPLAGTCEFHIISHDPLARVDAPNIVVHGGVSHDRIVGELLPQMDIICHPTRSDMSSYVLVEAALSGLPGVASRVGGIPDLVRHGQTGFLVDRDDEAGFVDALRELIASPDRRLAMGAAAAAFARPRFDAEANYNRLVSEMIAR